MFLAVSWRRVESGTRPGISGFLPRFMRLVWFSIDVHARSSRCYRAWVSLEKLSTVPWSHGCIRQPGVMLPRLLRLATFCCHWGSLPGGGLRKEVCLRLASIEPTKGPVQIANDVPGAHKNLSFK